MRLIHTLAAIAIAVAPLPALADVKDAVMNKEGYWGIDVDSGACAASMTLQGGAVFLLRGDQGEVTFGFFAKSAIATGKAGRIQTEAGGVDFEPHYTDDRTALYNVEAFDARALAALRQARQAQVLIDGRAVASMTLEGTGFEGALDGVVACSKGESGWWGKGVGATAAADEGPALNKEGVWALQASKEPSICVAYALVGDDRHLQVLTAGDQVILAVGAIKDKLPRGRRGKVETDGYAFAFKPNYDGDDYMSLEDPLDSQAVFTMRRAKWIKVSVDGRMLLDAQLADSGFSQLIDDALACAAGHEGWWGKGARQAS